MKQTILKILLTIYYTIVYFATYWFLLNLIFSNVYSRAFDVVIIFLCIPVFGICLGLAGSTADKILR